MEAVDEQRLTIEALFRAEFARLVRSLGVADGHEHAADAVQEAFAIADEERSCWPPSVRLTQPSSTRSISTFSPREAALKALGRPRRRGLVVASGLLAITLVAGVVVVVTRDEPHRASTVAVGASSMPTTAATGPPFTASATGDGIELTVTLGTSSIEIGQRVHVHVV